MFFLEKDGAQKSYMPGDIKGTGKSKLRPPRNNNYKFESGSPERAGPSFRPCSATGFAPDCPLSPSRWHGATKKPCPAPKRMQIRRDALIHVYPLLFLSGPGEK